MEAAMNEICDKWGGPRQYLLQQYPTASARKMFAAELLALLPLDSTQTYVEEPVPTIVEAQIKDNTALCFHPAMFTFQKLGSTKVPPGKSLASSLTQEYLNDGFVTEGEPLRVNQPPRLSETSTPAPWCTATEMPGVNPNDPPVTTYFPPNQVMAQSIGHQKSQARVTTLLAMCSIMIEDKMTSDEFQAVLSHIMADASPTRLDFHV